MMNTVSMLFLEVLYSRIMSRRRNCRKSCWSYYAILLVVLLSFLVISKAFHFDPNTHHFNPYWISSPHNNYFGGTKITSSSSQTFQCNSVPIVKGSEAYDLDAIEEEIKNEKSSQRLKFDKSSRFNKRLAKKRRRSDGRPTCSVKPTGKTTNSKRGGNVSVGKKDHRKSKTMDEEKQPMPPWLSRYENEDFVTAPFYIGDASQPTSVLKPTERDKSHMQRLYLALNGVYRHTPTSETSISSSSIDFTPEASQYFTKHEIHDIMDAIRVASQENTNLMAGCADFLYLMLTLEEEGVLIRSGVSLNNEPWADDDISSNGNLEWENGSEQGAGQPEPFSIMTRDVLVAAAFHYCDCVRARKAGVYEYARQAMEASIDTTSSWEVPAGEQLSLPPRVDRLDGLDVGVKGQDSAKTSIVERDAMLLGANSVRNSPIDHFGDESVKIVAGAARLKRAEIMATTVNSNGRLVSNSAMSKSKDDAEILRSFLVSLSEDWRALVIRSAACLYRLKGITDDMDIDGTVDNGANVSTGSSSLIRSTKIVARDAFKVYAPLAQRLGMQRLKSELENRAFRVLYPRQYSVASSLYRTGMDEIKSIIQVLSSKIEQLLKSDLVFIDQVEDVTVSSRVKEPYSLWRKMIRYRKEAADAKNNINRQLAPSLKWIPDVIALRVVLRARQLSSLEDQESLSTREKMMCYYALQIISDVWPASARNKAKDYIKHPKPNGYQSLHYTASLIIAEEEWPFEVQIRSEEMNRVAEFGVAAHWDYKLQNKAIEYLPGTSHPSRITPLLPLLSELELEEQIIEKNTTRVTGKGRIASYIDALAASRETIVQNNLFIFLSSTERAIDGNIVSIDPSANKVADVLRKFGANIDEKVLNDIPTGGLKIYRNGVGASLDEKLYNGDVLTLPLILIDSLHFGSPSLCN